MKLNRDTLFDILAGILAVAGGRLAYIVLVSIVSHLLGEASRGAAGSLLWILKMLFSPLGWLPYILWGSLIGMAYSRITQPNWRVTLIVACVLLLFVHDALWYRGGSYRVDLVLSRLGRLFTSAFWQQAWLFLPFWFIPHLTAVALLPSWRRGVEDWFAPSQRRVH
ncbi:MAG: hypothetical protein C4335_02440 [Armatimonadota bacterium]